jgi:hypothetical protein
MFVLTTILLDFSSGKRQDFLLCFKLHGLDKLGGLDRQIGLGN